MEGKLPENILLFTRLLRASGINIGSDGVTDAISAIKTLGLKSKRAFYFSLLACLKKKKKMKLFLGRLSIYFGKIQSFRKRQGTCCCLELG